MFLLRMILDFKFKDYFIDTGYKRRETGVTIVAPIQFIAFALYLSEQQTKTTGKYCSKMPFNILTSLYSFFLIIQKPAALLSTRISAMAIICFLGL